MGELLMKAGFAVLAATLLTLYADQHQLPALFLSVLFALFSLIRGVP